MFRYKVKNYSPKNEEDEFYRPLFSVTSINDEECIFFLYKVYDDEIKIDEYKNIILKKLNKKWKSNHSSIEGMEFESHHDTFEKAFKGYLKGEREFYTHIIKKITKRKENHYILEVDTLGKIGRFCFDELHPLASEGYTFQSKYPIFNDAWQRLIYGDISKDEIEDKIIISTLENMNYPDEKSYSYSSIDRYFDDMISNGDMIKITNLSHNNYYDCTKWIERLQQKMKDVSIYAYPTDTLNGKAPRPKGSSYWFIKATKDGETKHGLMTFSTNFINWF